MGAYRTDYLMLAAYFTHREFYEAAKAAGHGDGDAVYEKFEEPFDDDGVKPEITAPHNFAVIGDSMGGEYIIIGRILAKSIEGGAGFPILDCGVLWTDGEADLIALLIEQTFPFLRDVSGEVGVYLFTHYR